MNLSRRIHDQAIRDTIQALRYEAGLSRRVLVHLKALERDLKAAIAEAGVPTSQRKLKALLREAQELIQERFGGAQGVFDDEIPQFVSARSEATRAALNGLVKVDIWRHSLTQEQIQAIASDTLISGAPSAEWWAAQQTDTAMRFSRIVRGGMLRGATGDEMAREVRDAMGIAMRNAQSLVRTSVISVNNAAQVALYDANADLLNGVEWTATLDRRTCLVAGTPVSTPNGEVPIDALKIGDLVISGAMRPKKVISFMSRKVKKTVIVTLSNGQKIRCTEDHMWLNANQEWVEAGDLKSGDALAFALQ